MRILLVENNEIVAKLILDLLKKDRIGSDLVTGSTDVLQYVQKQIYDLVIMDSADSDSDCIGILKAVREKDKRIPIMIVSEKKDPIDIVYAFDSGADDYVVRPFSNIEFMARVRALMRRNGEIQEDYIVFGDVVLNFRNCELGSVSGTSLKLSLKEFQILEMLFRNPQQIITKERLFEKIWGTDSNAEYNNVEVYMSFLRKKFRYLKVKAVINTSRGIGYSLEKEKCIKL
ncbi:MAG: response regulator transcription factor [Treponema sp.]|jgi:DNA-binding response OmpR family regulator|nr:response regulator transcription factor [Treponema sp.]